MNEKVTAAFDKLLGINSSAWITIGAACGALVWFGILAGGLYSRLGDVEDQQHPTKLCERVTHCETNQANSIWELKAELRSVQQKLEERGIRIGNLEQHVYELKTKSMSRPDPFTGTMGRILEERIKDLEAKP